MRVFTSVSAAGLAAALSIGIALSATAAPLFSQPIDFGPFWASQNDPIFFGNFATAYDNFSLAATSEIDTVRFKGTYFTGNPQTPAAPGTITGFSLQFYADSAGQPGASEFSLAVAGNASETFDFTDALGFDVYDYTIALPGSGFTVSGGTTHWLSLVPDLDFPPQWGWEVSNAGDDISYQDFNGTRFERSGDLTFELDGVQLVPEPPSWALLIAGLTGMGAFATTRRRSRRTNNPPNAPCGWGLSRPIH